MNTIQLNKLCNLHDGENIIFCKTNFLLQEFSYIQTLPHEVTLISGNSDYVIDYSNYLPHLPLNVKKWYAQNTMIDHPIVKPLPLGIENYLPAKRKGHGVGYDRVKIKDQIISSYTNRTSTKFIYANFQPNTNPQHRNFIKSLCQEIEFITWEEPNLSLPQFFDNVLDYEAVICPDGNGPDTHRFYEVLYMGRIPIVFNKTLYNLLYKNFPSILIEDTNQLSNYNFMRDKINEVKSKTYNLEMLNIDWWVNRIINNF